jgi:RimJ/RimL family protein N-acetyltransferase
MALKKTVEQHRGKDARDRTSLRSRVLHCLSVTLREMRATPSEIWTERALLRRLDSGDLAEFAKMNADADVMRFFPNPWTLDESRAVLQRINSAFDERGFGIYAVEFESHFAGVVGLSIPSFRSWFTPCVEVLWRLQTCFWGKGLAPETARAVLSMAFSTLLLPEVFAFTVPENRQSIRVMQKLEMKQHEPAFFDHPAVEAPALKRHVLYHVTPSSLLESRSKSD